MGKLVVTEFVSVDGVFEDPGGAEGYENGGWTYDYDRGDDEFKLDEVMEAEVQLLARVTTRGSRLLGRHATVSSPTSSTPIARSLSRPRSPSPAGRTLRSSPPTSQRPSPIRSLTDGVVLVADSGTLVQRLLAHDLVDELHLMVFPTILGRGKRLFPDAIDRVKLRLADSRTVGPDSVLVHTYVREA
jgi:hypothetical protein